MSEVGSRLLLSTVLLHVTLLHSICLLTDGITPLEADNLILVTCSALCTSRRVYIKQVLANGLRPQHWRT